MILLEGISGDAHLSLIQTAGAPEAIRSAADPQSKVTNGSDRWRSFVDVLVYIPNSDFHFIYS